MSYKVYQRGFVFHVPDEAYKGEIERGHSQPFIGDMDVLKEFFELYPERKRVFIDVGGHIGLFAVPYSRFFNMVYSYEPHDDNFSYLNKNIGENYVANVRSFNKAVSFEHDRVKIIGHDQDRLLNEDEVPRYSGMYLSVPGEDIEAVKLDNKHLNQEVDFIKIDVEGQEMDVLKSAEGILKRYKPFLQIELKDFPFSKTTTNEVIKYLESLGYKLFKKKVDYFFISA